MITNLWEKVAGKSAEHKEAEERCQRFKKQLSDIEEKKRKEEEDNRKRANEFYWGPKGKQQISQKRLDEIRTKVLERKEEQILILLLFGMTGSGKSSFANSCRTALNDMDIPTTYHHVAQDVLTVSKKFKTDWYENIQLVDMPGISESDAIKNRDIEDIASGKVSFRSKITTQLQITERCEASPGEDKVDCVIIVARFDADLPPEIKRQLKTVYDLAGSGEISCHLLLTHLDVCDPDFKKSENLSSIYDSAKVQAAVKRMSEETGFPPYAISFVKNYTTELEADVNMKQHHLMVLKRIIHTAEEQIKAKKTAEWENARYKEKVAAKAEQDKFEAMEMERKMKKGLFNLEGYFTRAEAFFVILFLAVAALMMYLSLRNN